jgi:hypothetical protein
MTRYRIYGFAKKLKGRVLQHGWRYDRIEGGMKGKGKKRAGRRG